MFKWLFLKFAGGYNSSIIGGFLTNVQVGLRKGWDRSFLGRAIYGGNENVGTTCGRPQMAPSFLTNSVLLRILSHYEVFFGALLAIAPIAPTMVCAGLAGGTLVSFGVSRLLRGGRIISAPTSVGKLRSFFSGKVGREEGQMRASVPTMGEGCAKGGSGVPLADDHRSSLRVRWNVPLINWLVLAFLVLTFIYSLTSLDVAGSLKVWAIYAIFISMFFVAREAIKTKKDLHIACWILALFGATVALYGVYQNFFGSSSGHAWLDEDMFTGISVRVYSTLGNPNVLGEYLLLTIPVTVGLLWQGLMNFKKDDHRSSLQNWLKIIVLLGCVGIQLLCMVYTQSRGCWIGLLFSALIFILFVDKRWIALFFVALVAAPFILPQSILDRLTSVGNMGDSSTSYRVSIWMGTLNMLQDFWLTGVGLGAAAFAKVYPFYSYSMITAPHAHNIYLETISEMGIVGLGILLTICVVFVGRVLREYVRGGKVKNIIAIAFMAGFLGFMLQGAFDYVWYNYRIFLLFWMFLGLGSSLNNFSQRE